MQLSVRLALLLGLLPSPLLAQQQPRKLQLADSTLTEPDQELDGFSGRFNKVHVISARLRGVRAASKTVYWVSADNRQLTAYQAGKLRWSTNVTAPFVAEIPTVRIKSMVLTSNIIFVNFAPRGMAEVDRETGRVSGRYFDRDPNHLVAEPEPGRP